MIADLPGRGAAQHARRLEAQEAARYRYLMSWVEGHAIGHVGLGVPDGRRADELCEFRGLGLVDDLWVEPSFRGRGYGRALMVALAGVARAAGLSGLALDTGLDEGFAAARALYRSLGYRDRGGVFLVSARNPPGSPLPVFIEVLTIWTTSFDPAQNGPQ